MNNKKAQKPNIWQITLSTIAAAFGVQSQRNQDRDFKHGSLYTYIIAGVIFTLLFVITVVMVVKLVLANSGL